MRRFSQRSHLVTLSEINITPLLDLAFVLLIIFVITTPLLEQGLELKLPKGGRPDRPLRKEDFVTVEVHPTGGYQMAGRPMSAAQVQQELARLARTNPNLTVLMRADRATPYDHVFQLTEICSKLSLRVSFRSEPQPRR